MERHLITGSMLHDLIRCDHRVALDVHGDPAQRAEPNEFVELLWEGGLEHENEIVARLLAATPGAVDLRTAEPGSRQVLTALAMDAMAPLIVGGEIEADDLLGRPDLLRLDGEGYIPGDIKLGAAEDGQPCVPRLRYAVQIALYADVLDRLGRLGDLLLIAEGAFLDPIQHGVDEFMPEPMHRDPALDRFSGLVAPVEHLQAGTLDRGPKVVVVEVGGSTASRT